MQMNFISQKKKFLWNNENNLNNLIQSFLIMRYESKDC